MKKKEKDRKKVPEKPNELDSVELKNQLARALADYDNLKKRVDKERGDFRKLASLGFIARLLPIFDMLEDAQRHLKDSGLAIIIKELTDLFEQEDVEKIKIGEGTEFNENLHEVVEVLEDQKLKENTIIEEVLTGWKYKNGPVIRPVKVKVAGKTKNQI